MDVDFIAVSFVKTADVINNLKSYLSSRCDKVIEIVAKIESHDSVPNAQDIIEASDGIMIARGDLGTALPLSCSALLCSRFCSLGINSILTMYTYSFLASIATMQVAFTFCRNGLVKGMAATDLLTCLLACLLAALLPCLLARLFA